MRSLYEKWSSLRVGRCMRFEALCLPHPLSGMPDPLLSHIHLAFPPPANHDPFTDLGQGGLRGRPVFRFGGTAAVVQVCKLTGGQPSRGREQQSSRHFSSNQHTSSTQQQQLEQQQQHSGSSPAGSCGTAFCSHPPSSYKKRLGKLGATARGGGGVEAC